MPVAPSIFEIGNFFTEVFCSANQITWYEKFYRYFQTVFSKFEIGNLFYTEGENGLLNFKMSYSDVTRFAEQENLSTKIAYLKN